MTRVAMRVYTALTITLLGAAAIMATTQAPEDPALGAAARTLYVHLPFAINTYLFCAAAFVAAGGYLATRDLRWDRWAGASGTGAAVGSTLVLLTGMVLARGAWGHWWVWTPKLTFSLVLWLLLAGNMAIRLCIAAPARRAMASAVYSAVALLDTPLVYLSVKLLPDAHPTSVALDAGARVALLLSVAGITMLCTGLLVLAARSAVIRHGGTLGAGETRVDAAAIQPSPRG